VKAILFVGAALLLCGCSASDFGDNIDQAQFVEGPHTQRCTGVVERVDDTGVTIDDNPMAILTMTVTPPGGAPTYEAKPHVLVGRLDVPRRGDTLNLSCDPANPGNTKVIDEES
jgi:hypothetical protein